MNELFQGDPGDRGDPGPPGVLTTPSLPLKGLCSVPFLHKLLRNEI